MTDLFLYLMGFGIGALVGFYYFGGLWLTIQKLPHSRQPNRLLFLSFVTRLIPTLLIMYMLISKDPGMFIAMLISFFAVRFFMTKRISPCQGGPSQKQNVSNSGTKKDTALCNPNSR